MNELLKEIEMISDLLNKTNDEKIKLELYFYIAYLKEELNESKNS